MNLKGLLTSNWSLRIMVIGWIVTASLSLYMLNNLNMIVHESLYDFGLQFNYLWANPYWMYLNLIYATLGASSALAFFAMMIGFYRSKNVAPKIVKVPQKVAEPKIVKKQKDKEDKPIVQTKIVKANNSELAISCPKCRKVFSRPMVMLNFEGGETRLVNVCPYCNYDLGQKQEEKPPNTEFQIKGQDEVEADRRLEDRY